MGFIWMTRRSNWYPRTRSILRWNDERRDTLSNQRRDMLSSQEGLGKHSPQPALESALICSCYFTKPCKLIVVSNEYISNEYIYFTAG